MNRESDLEWIKKHHNDEFERIKKQPAILCSNCGGLFAADIKPDIAEKKFICSFCKEKERGVKIRQKNV